MKSKIEKIKDVLKLEKEPVGVKYTDDLPKEKEDGYYTVCGAILAASEGKIIVISKETCACPGGIVHLGLAKGVRLHGKILVEGEKLWVDLKAFCKAIKDTRKIAMPPLGLSNNIVFYPLREEIYNPDLIIFLVNAEQACRLITLDQFWDGKQKPMEMRGSLCWSSVTYPFVSGNVNVSLGDITARRMENYDPTLLIVSIPFVRFDRILQAIDRSSAGIAEPSKLFKRITEKMISRRYKFGKQ